ncbi:hypothetical protein AB0D11_02115 [Streptomyces monashensis]|uniref:hypothetical protein n=1 Tax=Streptomyces monashensis TaxID=1678012 RepID=UPI0033FB5694
MSASYDDVMVSLGLEPSRPKRGRPTGSKNKVPSPCGTYAAYMQHKVRREQACEACLEAKRQYYRVWYAKNGDRIRASRRKGGAS